LLRFRDGPPSGGAQLSAFALRRRLLRGGSLGGATREHLTKLCDLSVYSCLLLFEASDGSGDELVSK